MTQARVRTRQGSPVIRIGLLAGGIGVLMVVVGVLIFLSDQQARRSPFTPAVYPGLSEWGMNDVQSNSRTVFYRGADIAPDAVAEFYNQQLRNHYGDAEEQCVRVPATGEYPVNPNNPFAIPYQFKCMFDNSGFNATQYTQVVIYPGYTNNPDPAVNLPGGTIVEYQQFWAS